MDFDNHKLNLDLPWRIGEEAFLKIVELIHQKVNTPNCLVEFGSGASSIRLVLSFPKTQIISLEADLDCYHQTQELAQEFLEDPTLFNLKYQSLSFQKYGLSVFSDHAHWCKPRSVILSYTQDDSLTDLTIDCVIIDGPPFYTVRGREACLYQVYNQLRVGGIVILDDFNRESEKIILQNWLSVYPDSFTVEIVEVGHHLAILEKKQSVQPDWLNSNKDNIEINEKYKKLTTAFLNLKNADLIKVFYSLPSDITLPILNRKDNIDDFFKIISTIQIIYQSLAGQLDVTCTSHSNLPTEELSGLQTASLCCCLELLGFTQ